MRWPRCSATQAAASSKAGRVSAEARVPNLTAAGRGSTILAPRPAPAFGCVWLAVAGAHLAGQPLNHELTSLGARRVRVTKTAKEYRLYALDTVPPKPGMVHVPGEEAYAIEVEVWELSEAAFGAFVARVPSPMTIGMTKLADGSLIKGFSCEPYALNGAREISQFGGWRAFRASA